MLSAMLHRAVLPVQNLQVGANWHSIVGPLAKAVEIHRQGFAVCSKAHLDTAASKAMEAYLVLQWVSTELQ